MQIRTTLLPNQKNREFYFDAEECIRYHEEETGIVLSYNAKDIIKTYAKFINDGYSDGYTDGYQAGLEAAHNEACNFISEPAQVGRSVSDNELELLQHIHNRETQRQRL